MIKLKFHHKNDPLFLLIFLFLPWLISIVLFNFGHEELGRLIAYQGLMIGLILFYVGYLIFTKKFKILNIKIKGKKYDFPARALGFLLVGLIVYIMGPYSKANISNYMNSNINQKTVDVIQVQSPVFQAVVRRQKVITQDGVVYHSYFGSYPIHTGVYEVKYLPESNFILSAKLIVSDNEK